MKKKIVIIALALMASVISVQAQVWLGQNPDFPKPMQGWEITAVDNNVAWTFGFTLDSTIGNESWGWTNTDYTFSKTTNGGTVWKKGNFPLVDTGSAINLSATDSSHAWLNYNEFAGGSKVFKTADGGLSWTETNPGMPTFANGVYFFDVMNGVIFCDADSTDYNIYTTADGGTSWNPVNPNDIPDVTDADEYGNGGCFVTRENSIWFITYYGRVFFSNDKGHHWSVWDSPVNPNPDAFNTQLATDDSGTIYQVYYAERDSVTSFTDSFWIYRRGVNDASWTDVTPANNINYVSGISGIPGTSNIIINISSLDTAVANETRVSYDKGATWQTIDNSHRKGFVTFISTVTGYCSELPNNYNSPSQHIFKYNGTPLTGLLNPKPLNVVFNISPNPSNGFIDVTISSPKKEDYWILINDMSGKLIRKTEVSNAAEHNERIDLRDVPSGTYMVTVSSAEGAVSKKIIRQ